ncbi:MAG: hypothetical protein WBF17_06755 [Phycisphaerae bacterium]
MMKSGRFAAGADLQRAASRDGNTQAMLAFTIGWQEVLIIILFLLGLIVIPLPGRWMRRAPRKPLRWSEEFLAAPIPTIHEVTEAFFCSYPRGEYTLEGRERFRLTFRRGPPPRDDDGQVVLSLRGDERPGELPVALRVLFQPRADALLITAKHEVHAAKSLGAVTRKKLAAIFRQEVRDYRTYLRDNFGTPESFADPAQRPTKRIPAKRKGD